MPVAMGISCGKCGSVYFVAHQDNARRIRFDDTDKLCPSYQLTFHCSAVHFFEKREMLHTPFLHTVFSVATLNGVTNCRFHHSLS